MAPLKPGVRYGTPQPRGQLNLDSKLISLALVSESGKEFYVELTDTYSVEDCSDFVIQNVLPQLDPLQYGQSLVGARASLRRFLGCFGVELEVCSDAPHWDWEFFCDLVCADHQPWPVQVVNQPTDLTSFFNQVRTLLDLRIDGSLPQGACAKAVGDQWL